MKTTIHETKNPFSISALRGGCLRKLGGSIVSSAAFLMGMAAVVLASMFALSAPSFAADPIHREITGTGNIDITNEDVIHGNDTSIRADHSGTGYIEITNEGNLDSWENDGIHADHSGTGRIEITNESIVNAYKTGIRAEHAGTGDVEITNERNAVGRDTGIRADHDGTGDIEITNEDNVDGLNIGIHADHIGEGDVEITNKRSVWGNFGIRAEHTDDGDIEITNEGTVKGDNTGIYADHDNEGDVEITNEGTVKKSDIGIHVEHVGEGDVEITNEGTVMADNIGVHAEHAGTGDVEITNESSISGGIDADHTGTGDVEITNEGSSSIAADHTGTGDVEITNEGSSSGIAADHSGTGDIGIIHEGSVSWAYNSTRITGIYAEHAGTGDIGITNKGGISDIGWTGGRTGSLGVHAEHSGTGDIGITNETFLNETDNGVRADHAGVGDIRITNKKRIFAQDIGIHADHIGTGDIWVVNKGYVWGGNIGIRTDHAGTGNIGITNEGSSSMNADHAGTGDVEITNKGSGGMNADHAGTGDIGITNEGNGNISADHAGTGDIGIINEDEAEKIRAEHAGTGNILITNEGGVTRQFWEFPIASTGIHAEHTGTGDVEIVNEGEVRTDSPFIGGVGVHVDHAGAGDIEITNESIINAGDIGIHADHAGTGDIVVKINDGSTVSSDGTNRVEVLYIDDGNGETRTDLSVVNVDDTGIRADHAGTGDIVLKIDDGGTVSANRGYGIKASHISNGTGEIEIDLSGTVSGGTNNGPISMASSGDKTLILRPGFVLNSGQSHVDIISAGTGDGILELNQDDDPLEDDATPASETLDFEDLNFQGFDEFAKKGQNTWKISGAASDTEMFDTATIWEGTLRFTGGVTFKMAPAATGSDPNYFKIADNAVLEIVGSNNLNGNLNNLGKIVFTYDPDAAQHPANALEVGNDYKGGGGVVFDVGSGGWQADKFRIGRNKDLAEITKVGISGEVSNFVSSENEYLPMVIEVVGTANPGSFITGVIGGYDVNHHKYLLGHYPETDAQGNITMHKWKFRRGAELSTVSGTGSSYEDDLTEEVNPEEEITLDPDDEDEDSELGLRADVRGHAGGVWGRQQSLRTSAGPSVIAGRGLRKADERVHFGYDTPAMDFMGGDMVVRTSVSRGLSISDVFSSSGRSRINMESDAAALSALWRSPGGFYADGRTRYVRSSSNISTEGFALARDNEGVGVGASAKAGYRFTVPLGGMDFSVAPQVQLLWSSVNFDDFTGLTGEVVSLEDGELVTGRLGLLWDGEWQDVSGSGRIYGKMNLHNALDGETIVSVSGVPLSRERSGLSADGRLGVSYEWNEGYAVRGEVSALRPGDAGEIRADFGMSIDF